MAKAPAALALKCCARYRKVIGPHKGGSGRSAVAGATRGLAVRCTARMGAGTERSEC